MKIKAGMSVDYLAPVRGGVIEGTGKVFGIEPTKTGDRVIVIDYDRRKFVALRQSQVMVKAK